MVGLFDGNRLLPRLHARVQDGRAFHLRNDRRSGDLGFVGDLGYQKGAQHGEFRQYPVVNSSDTHRLA